MDHETELIIGDQHKVREMLGTEGWKVAHRFLLNKILTLNDAFNIVTVDPQQMLIDLQSRKYASVILTQFVNELVGMGQAAIENKVIEEKGYIRRD